MNRRTYLTTIAIVIACAFVYAHSVRDEHFRVDPAHGDVAEPLKKLTNTPTLDPMSSQPTDSVDFKPPVLE